MIVPVNGEPIHLGSLTLTPFTGLYLTDGQGVPSTGYLAEFNGKRWLIPGDTRVYDLAQLPCFGRLDGVSELEREPTDYWHERHVDLISRQFSITAPQLQVTAAMMGERVNL